MGSSAPTTESEAGFATPAAVVISLAVATVALAVQSRAILAVHAAEADYGRTSAEITLEGVEALAVRALYDGDGLPGGSATIDLEGQPYTVHADTEATKLGLAEAAALSVDQLRALGASNPARVQQGLQQLAAEGGVVPGAVAELDPARRWRTCATGWISPYGGALSLSAQGPGRRAAHAGEIWRITARSPVGWTEDRTLRITGDATSPVRILDRHFYRLSPGDGLCRLALPPT